ncbi:MAG TPA: superoxide reductase [Candidatus Omnitrophica bacterium]|nr:MAG: superoxide reductase [Candidatus Omnitrophota bacterium]RKY43674.1 MAG: superoxide reductase [Candidatus Omnitrophota bacterium]HEC69403.1 superoxide reductase [Candidatus Omnitrophota bacterium]
MPIGELFQSADWKKEKHIPVIEVEKGRGEVKVKVSVGKEISHPNTTEHHIAWIDVYFLPEGEKFPYQIGKFEFSAHGASIQGPNTSGVYTRPVVELAFKTEKSGVILASSYCNIHGLWQNSKEINLE